jgi:uncharacterized protein
MPVERTIAGVSTSVTAFVGYTQRGITNEPTQLFDYGDFERAFGGLHLDSPLSYAVQQFFQNGGLEAWVVRVAGPADIEGDEATKTGMYALEDVDLLNILCLPPLSGSPEPGAVALLAAATTYCEKRRAFLIIDLPEDVETVAEARNWVVDPGRTKSSNAAAYFPWVVLDDPLRDRLRAFPPSGMLAGLYARTDLDHGVWKSPAGTDAALRGAQGVAYDLSEAENGVLNPLGLNAIRSFPTSGTVAWGARTLVGSDEAASDWKYIAVRRLALFLEQSLYRGTEWAVFEPNDEPLWAQLRLTVGAFMHDLFRQGAFQGSSPRDAYFVKCDSETTTQSDIDLGVVNIVVGFAPLRPAEFVILRITQLAAV